MRPRDPKRVHLPRNISAKDRAVQFPDLLHERGGQLLCRACDSVVDHRRKSSIHQHFATAKHASCTAESSGGPTGEDTEQEAAGAEGTEEQTCDGGEACAEVDVPPHERDHAAERRSLKMNMGGRQCCVKNCSGRSHDHLGRKIPNGLTFHCFPAWRRCEGAQISELTMRRRAAWVAAVDRACISFSRISKSMRVCSRHFHSGKPAYEMLQSDPDWVPSLELGHGPANRRLSKRLLESAESRTSNKTKKRRRKMSLSTLRPPRREPESGGPVSAPDFSWRKAKSQLHSVLKPTPSSGTPDGEAVHAGKEEAFRDFFREFLRSSLEASRRSKQTSNSTPPSVRESPLRSSECVGCERLQRTITALQEELTQRSVGHKDTEVSRGLDSSPVPPEGAPLSPVPSEGAPLSPVPSEGAPLSPVPSEGALLSPVPSEGAPLSPGLEEMEEEMPDWAEPFEEQEEEGGEADDENSHPRVWRSKARYVPNFRAQWLQQYWFLRYSEKRNVMWCEVCRLHHDRKAPDHGMINGSGYFKVYFIKKHMNSLCHRVNVERYRKTTKAMGWKGTGGEG